MKILLVYPNSMAESGFKPIGISMLSAVLKRAGHDVSLFDTTFYDLGGKSVHDIGADLLNFKKVTFPPEVYEQKPGVDEDFRKALKSFKPDLVGFSTMTTMIATTLRLAKIAKESGVPVIVGGKHPTVAPVETIHNPNIDMICIGEGEEAFVELANKMESNKNITNIKNIWVKQAGRIFKNELRPLVDINALPYPDWDIWDKRQFYKPYEGNIYIGGDIESARGCVYNCSYCINEYLHKLYAGKGSFYRQKTPDRIVQEVAYLRDKYKIDFLKFHDEDFLLRPVSVLKEISEKYRKEVNIPFVVEINANSVTYEKARLLREMNCVSASIGLESGTYEYRKTVLNRPIPDNETIISACRTLNELGIRTVSFNMIGLPFQTRDEIFETIELNKKAGFRSCAVGFFYPYPGSKLRDVCLKEGFIRGDEDAVNTRLETILSMPQISKEELKGLMRTFIMYTRASEKMYPLIKFCEKNTPLSNTIFRFLRQIYYYKIHGFRRPKPKTAF